MKLVNLYDQVEAAGYTYYLEFTRNFVIDLDKYRIRRLRETKTIRDEFFRADKSWMLTGEAGE